MTNKKAKGQTFMFGAVILMISNILVKAIGALFKIPLQNLIHEEGMAYFQAAYNIYVSFYMISTAGIPVAISRMIASSNSKGNRKEVERIFKVSFWLFFVVGIIGTAAMMIFAKNFAKAASLDGSEYAMMFIAPTLFFICISSAYRGYYQGLQNMLPTGVSQVIESLGKLSIGLIAGFYFMSKGYPVHKVAGYVISGVTIGVIAATLYIMIFKKMFSSAQNESETSLPVASSGSILKELIAISIPISLASSIMGLTNFVDTMLVARRISDSLIGNASTSAEIAAVTEYAKRCYGSYAIPQTLFNMPTTLIYPFAISALPALSKYYSTGEKDKAEGLMNSTFRTASIVAFPCALGMAVMARPIISLLYDENAVSETVTNIDLAAPCLSILGFSVFFLGMISVTNSILQAYHFQNYTIISTVSGIIVKFVVSYILLGIPSVGLTGSAIGTALCYLTIMLLNTLFIVLKIKIFPRIKTTFLKPFLSAVICVIPCRIVYELLSGRISSKICTLVSVCVAGVVYIAVLLLIKGLSESDIAMLPKSEKIIKLLKKYNLITASESVTEK